MKLSAAAFLFAAASLCTAQSSPSIDTTFGATIVQPLVSSSATLGCPITLTSATLTPRLALLHASSAADSMPSIDLAFQNTSGKSIRSMNLGAELWVKKSVYDLKAERFELRLTASAAVGSDAAFNYLRHLHLPQSPSPSGIARIDLEQVTFADGSLWTAQKASGCGIGPDQALLLVR
jgi:hypothetical protein